jgi:outer membrane protein TolC
MSIQMETEIILTKTIRQAPDLPSMPEINAVLAMRLDYHTQLLSKELAELSYKASMGTFLPTVSARFSYGYGREATKGKATTSLIIRLCSSV